MKASTTAEYKNIIGECRELFMNKASDYGTAWRILRLPSITDQIFIKANRIRSIQAKGVNKVGEAITDEFVGIIKYCLITLVQYYDLFADKTMGLLENKNQDYGEAWRDMRVSSITDIILMKLFRVKQIEDNQGQTKVSEGVDANYMDMIDYSVFALILLKENK